MGKKKSATDREVSVITSIFIAKPGISLGEAIKLARVILDTADALARQER